MATTVEARQNLGRMGNIPMDLTNNTIVKPLKPGHGIQTSHLENMFGEKRLLSSGKIPKPGHGIQTSHSNMFGEKRLLNNDLSTEVAIGDFLQD